VQGFLGGRIRALRVGAFAIGWLCVLASIGLGLAPFVAYVATVDPSALTTAILATGIFVSIVNIFISLLNLSAD
jgi:hypothetical protein